MRLTQGVGGRLATSVWPMAIKEDSKIAVRLNFVWLLPDHSSLKCFAPLYFALKIQFQKRYSTKNIKFLFFVRNLKPDILQQRTFV